MECRNCSSKEQVRLTNRGLLCQHCFHILRLYREGVRIIGEEGDERLLQPDAHKVPPGHHGH